MSFDDYLRSSKAGAESAKSLRRAVSLDRVGKGIRIGAKAVGAGMIALGASKLAGSLVRKEHKRKAEALGAGAGAAASAAFIFGAYPRATIQNIAQRVGKKEAQTAFSFAKKGIFHFLKARF